MKILFVICILILLQSFHVNGQTSLNEFLLTSEQSEKVRAATEQLQLLNSKGYRVSPLQRLELRMQNRELLPEQFQYGLRLTPANPWEVRNNNRYFSSLTSNLYTENQILLNEALRERYTCAIFTAYFDELHHLHEQNAGIIKNQIKILEQQAGSNFFDADEYLDLQVDELDAIIEWEEVKLERITYINQAELLAGKHLGNISWKLEELISPRAAKQIVDSLTNISLSNLLQTYQQQRIDLAVNEYKLEKSNVNIGFIQTEFDNRRVEQNRTPINFSFGITIPITNPNKGDMTKRKLDVIEEQHDLDELKRSEGKEEQLIQQRIERLLLQYDNLVSRLETLENGSLAQTLSTIKGGDPRYILRFQENQLKIRIMLAKLNRDILLSFVEYLAFSDQLQQQPLINFLSADLSLLKR